MSTQLRSLWESLRESYWFIPAGIVVAMFGLAYLTQMVDEEYPIDITGMLPGAFRGGSFPANRPYPLRKGRVTSWNFSQTSG